MTLRGPTEGGVIKTAGRVFEVLEYLREVRRQVTVREVSERLGYPLSSTQVLMKSIATLGYLRYDPRARAYFATPMLARLGDWVLDSIHQGGRLFHVLGQVARDTGLTTILAVENDIYAQYVHVILGGQAIQFNVQPGTRRVLCMSGLGWAMLATHTDEEIARVVQRTNGRLGTGGQRVDPGYVAAQVRETRERGYAFSRGVVTEGIGIVALALPTGRSGERLAVGVGGLVERLEADRETLVRAIRERIFPAALDAETP
ncbi:MAG: hypothetical protein RIS35_109 [Pseudomonadota bacterium]|jgi:DNA-binding IclR family transcriptional regulator